MTNVLSVVVVRLLSLVRKIRRRVWTIKIKRFHTRYLHQPASLDLCIRLQRRAEEIYSDPYALVPCPAQLNRKGKCLKDRQLADMFRGVELSDFALPVETIDWLVNALDQKRPRVVLEFGSGVSTAVLCVALQRFHGVDGFRFLSVEQDSNEVERTQDRLSGLQGRASCRIVHVPLIPAVVDDQSTLVYDIDGMSHEHFAWLGKAEFVLIDGPFSKGPCRYETIPKIRANLAPNAYFVLDDGLRRKELLAAAMWEKEGIVVDGVFTIGEGVIIGKVPCSQATEVL